MCEFLIFNIQKRYEKQKNFGQLFGNFLEIQQLFGNFSKKIAIFWQLFETFIGNFFGIHRQLVAKPTCQALVYSSSLHSSINNSHWFVDLRNRRK